MSNKQEIIDYLYEFNTHADITIEEMADDLIEIPSGFWIKQNSNTYECSKCGETKEVRY